MKREHAHIGSHRGKHGLDGIHGFRVHDQVIRKNCRCNDQKNRPDGKRRAFQGAGSHVNRLLAERRYHGKNERYDRRNGTGFPCCHF